MLASGGHNAGIVSEPGHTHRQFRIKFAAAAEMSIGPDEWLAAADHRNGSWWPAWNEWLNEHSSASRVAPPPIGLPDADMPIIADAPGTYVLRK